MLERIRTSLLLEPADVPASDDRFEVVGAFNPVQCGQTTRLCCWFASPRGQGKSGLGLWDCPDGIQILV